MVHLLRGWHANELVRLVILHTDGVCRHKMWAVVLFIAGAVKKMTAGKTWRILIAQ
jgi:hypothetical protein